MEEEKLWFEKKLAMLKALIPQVLSLFWLHDANPRHASSILLQVVTCLLFSAKWVNIDLLSMETFEQTAVKSESKCNNVISRSQEHVFENFICKRWALSFRQQYFGRWWSLLGITNSNSPQSLYFHVGVLIDISMNTCITNQRIPR